MYESDIFKIKRNISLRGHRYENPYKESMKLRLLWTNDRIKTRADIKIEVEYLYDTVSSSLNEEFSKLWGLTNLGLSLDPRFYKFYAIRGDMLARRGEWSRAIEHYEKAIIMSRFDETVGESDHLYKEELFRCYKRRAENFYDEGFLLQSAADYEQLLNFSKNAVETQDRLLDILRELDRYEAFCYYWNQFMRNADKRRVSVLKTKQANYKIHLREIATARHILLEALEIDRTNTRANELLQTIYSIGHAMAAHSVIWCMHGCYDKALIVIEKCRDCDPYNPGYTLLKTIILRLSGRASEAIAWLQSVDKGFYKLLEPSRDKKGSIMGNLSIEQTKEQLIKQWHLLH